MLYLGHTKDTQFVLFMSEAPIIPADNQLTEKNGACATLRIATRESPLAMWQAHYIKDELQAAHPDIKIDIIGMTTKGDQILDRALSKVGGKGLFMKELEEALLAGRADIAVHSMKDVTVELPEGLEIAVVCEREQPYDAFVSNNYATLSELPDGAVVGTSSLRRQTQLMHRYPKLVFKDLRGNVNTRLQKLDDGVYDAIILAAAGLIRLGFEQRIAQMIPVSLCLPAIGQGIVGVECRSDDQRVKELLSALHDANADYCITAERAMNKALEGGCQVPIAGHAVLQGDSINLQGSVGDIDNGVLLQASASAKLADAESLGIMVADDLIRQGARDLIRKSLNS